MSRFARFRTAPGTAAGLAAAIVLIVAGALATGTTATAAGIDACDHYASKAVAQAETNDAFGCGGTYPRFQTAYDPHFRWCIGNDDGVLRNENFVRVLVLSRCAAAAWTREADAYCTDYADMATEQRQLADYLGCGVSGPRWDADFGAHYAWCMRTKDGRLPEGETARRKAALASCSGGRVDYPPSAKPFSGDLRVVDWCWEDVTMPNVYTRFNAVVQNAGPLTWVSKRDGEIRVGTRTATNDTREVVRAVYFVELYGLEAGERRIIRGADFGTTIAQSYPDGGVVLTHPDDVSAQQALATIQFSSDGVADFYAKYAGKKCRFPK